jgi:hypothetical protein
VKWTLLALTCDAPDGTATASMKTAPVNQSLGPAAVSALFLVICIAYLPFERTSVTPLHPRWRGSLDRPVGQPV